LAMRRSVFFLLNFCNRLMVPFFPP